MPNEMKAIATMFPLGTVIPYAGKADEENRRRLAQAGWLVCDGSPQDRVKYAKLYEVIGDIHGRGDAVKTFNIPDYRGRFLRGVDAGAGRDPDADVRDPTAAGGLRGNDVGSVQLDETRSHDHATIQMIGDNNIDGVDSTTVQSGDHHNEPRRTGLWGGKETRPTNAYVFWLILSGPSA